MVTAANRPRIAFLVDENVPNSVADFLIDRGHNVQFVRLVLPSGTPDPVIAAIGDKLSAVVVTWDRDFDALAQRIPDGNKAKFRRLGRLTFKCDYSNGAAQLARWIDMIEFHYAQCVAKADFRMIVQVQENGLKMF